MELLPTNDGESERDEVERDFIVIDVAELEQDGRDQVWRKVCQLALDHIADLDADGRNIY